MHWFARKNKTVITLDAYKKRQLVATQLTGYSLSAAMEDKAVVSKNKYYHNKYVNKETGKTTKLKGIDLIKAIANETLFLNMNIYNSED